MTNSWEKRVNFFYQQSDFGACISWNCSSDLEVVVFSLFYLCTLMAPQGLLVHGWLVGECWKMLLTGQR